MKTLGIDKPFELESIALGPDGATLPGFADGYIDPCDRDTGGGTHHPAWHILFDKDTEQGCWWNFSLPRNFLKQHAVKIKVYWFAPILNVGSVVWGVRVLGCKEGEDWFGADFGTEVTAEDVVQDVALELSVIEITIPAATHLLEEKDTVVLQLVRKVDDAKDDLDEDAGVAMVDFEFARDPNILVA